MDAQGYYLPLVALLANHEKIAGTAQERDTQLRSNGSVGLITTTFHLFSLEFPLQLDVSCTLVAMGLGTIPVELVRRRASRASRPSSLSSLAVDSV